MQVFLKTQQESAVQEEPVTHVLTEEIGALKAERYGEKLLSGYRPCLTM